jgi:hypothetical protein
MTKKGQKLEGVAFVLYFSSNEYYSGKNYLLEACSKHFKLLKGKTKFSKNYVSEGDVLATLT